MKKTTILITFLALILNLHCKTDDRVTRLLVSTSLKVALSNIQLKEFAAENKGKFKDYGWAVVDDTLVKKVTFPDHKVLMSNGTFSKLDAQSYLSLENLPKGVYPKALIIDGREYNLNEFYTVQESYKIPKSGFMLNSNGYLLSMDSCCPAKSSKDGNAISNAPPPRCVDYNGPLGNGQNDQGTFQSIINYIGSDCDKSGAGGANCFSEHSNGMGGCYNTHGGKLCSAYVQNFPPR